MKGLIARVMAAIASAMKGFFKVVVKGGKATYEWVTEKAAPAIGEAFVDTADAVGRTAHAAIHAVPNLLSRFTAGPAVAPAPTNESAPVAEQQAARRAVLDKSAADDRRRGLAITVKAAARALLRDQEPEGIPAPIRLWLSSLTERELGILARMSVEDVTLVLDGNDNQPLGRGMRAAAWDRTARVNPDAHAFVERSAARAAEQATPILQMRDHIEARAQERLQRRLRGLGPRS